jgi:hypothetical protein
MDIYFLYFALFVAIVIYIISPSLLGTAALLTFIIYVLSPEKIEQFLPEEQTLASRSVPFSSDGPYKGAVEENTDDDTDDLATSYNKFDIATVDDKIISELQCRNDPNIRYKPNKKFGNAIKEELNESESKPWWSVDEY